MAEVYPWPDNARAHVAAKLKELRCHQPGYDSEPADDWRKRGSTATLHGDDSLSGGVKHPFPLDAGKQDKTPRAIDEIKSLSPGRGGCGQLNGFPPQGNKWDAKLFDPIKVGVSNPATERITGATRLAAFRVRLNHLERCWLAAFKTDYRETHLMPSADVDRKLEERDSLSKAECTKLEMQLLHDILDAIRASNKPLRLSEAVWRSAATVVVVPQKGIEEKDKAAAGEDGDVALFEELVAKLKEKRREEQMSMARTYARATSLPDPSAPYFRRPSSAKEKKTPMEFLKRVSSFIFRH